MASMRKTQQRAVGNPQSKGGALSNIFAGHGGGKHDAAGFSKQKAGRPAGKVSGHPKAVPLRG